MSDVTHILNAIEQGDARAVDELLPAVYDELRRLAAWKLSREKPGQTLQATALVHEAYIRLVGEDAQNWRSRTHFFSAAAEAMRRILVDNARRKKSLRHGGKYRRVELENADLAIEDCSDDIVALDEALRELAESDKMKADLVKLRYFAGLGMEQAAEVLGLSLTTAKRHWRYARAWLYTRMSAGSE
ncbi:MAG: sigma-70 family RNA polymerase sigma factor [Sedimentisphaerales bacterium]|nr:sigma-70 family RNA polymerase sigma factor [Sedimentisphaerales bacterium]